MRHFLTASAILLVLAAAARAQWLETTIPVPDTFGGLSMPNCLAYDSTDNRVFVAGAATRTILVLDGRDGHRLARIPFEANVLALCYNPADNRVYVAAMDRDFVAVIDAGAMQMVDTIPTGHCPAALACNPTLNRVYSADFNGPGVTVIDCDGDSMLTAVQVGQQPLGICWNPNRNVVYCANNGSNTVSVIDATDNTVVSTVPTGSAPVAFVYNPDLDKLYTANYGSGTVTVIDGLADSVLANVGNGESFCRLCYNPANSKVYVADEGYRMVVIDCTADTILRRTSVRDSRDVAYNLENGRVYAAIEEGLAVLDGATDAVTAEVEFGYVGAAVCIADSGRRVFGAADDDALVGVIDCTTDSLLALVETDPRLQPTAACFNPITDRAYCAIAGANAVMVIDGVDNSIRQVLPSGVQPRALLYNPRGNKVYCANVGASGMQGTITVIDGAGGGVLRTIETGRVDGNVEQMICLNTAGDRLYEPLSSDNAVLVLDATADTEMCRVPTGGGYPYCACYGPAYDYLYVGVQNAVDVIDAKLNLMIAEVVVGYYPVTLCYVPVGAKVYTADLNSRTVSVIAGERPELVAQIDVVGRPNALCWDSRDNKIYCANEDSSVAVIDASKDTLIALVPVGKWPHALCYDSLNNRVYCACRFDSSIVVIDCFRDSVIAKIHVGAEPVALAWNPIEFRTYVANYSGASISIIRDSLYVGVRETMNDERGTMNGRATVVRGILFLPKMGTVPEGTVPIFVSSLLDVGGRKVMGLHAGANDVSHLAPGVYFVREAQAQAQAQGGTGPQVVHKIVVTE